MADSDVKYEIHIMNVPFNNTYKDVVYFSSKSERDTKFISLSQYHYSNLNIIVKNSAFILRGRWDSFNKCNYMMYRYTTKYSDGTYTSDWFYSFITDVSYNTRLGTIINHTIDVWQTYHTTANFNKETLIERGHVHINDDTFTRWLAPEPISTNASVEKPTDIFSSFIWKPTIICDTLSKPSDYESQANYFAYADTGDLTPLQTHIAKFTYGGIHSDDGTFTNASGLYRWHIYSGSIQGFTEIFTLPEYVFDNNIGIPSYNNFSHLSDIKAFKVIPYSFVGTSQGTELVSVVYHSGIANLTNFSNNVFPTHVEFDRENTNHVGNTTLASGYKPHNNKLFSSLCRAFKIFNRNGISIPIKVELIKSKTVGQVTYNNRLYVDLEMNTYADNCKIVIDNYNSLNKYFDLPVVFSMEFGFNSNVGVSQAQKQMNNIQQLYNMNYDRFMGYVSGVSQIGSGAIDIGTGGAMVNVGSNTGGARGTMQMTRGANSIGSGISETVSGFATIANTERNFRNDSFDYGNNIADTYQSIGISIGNNSLDRTNFTENNIKLRFAECSPVYDECRQVDEFLDRYGYAIGEIMKPSYFMFGTTDRPYYSYLKTNGSQLKIQAPNNDNVIFNDILNSGVTIWKDISYVGNYTLTNWLLPSN